MSLINDALKRANQAQKPNPAAQAPGEGLKPVERAAPSPTRFRKVAVLSVAALLVAAAGWFGWQAFKPETVGPVASATTARTAPPRPATPARAAPPAVERSAEAAPPPSVAAAAPPPKPTEPLPPKDGPHVPPAPRTEAAPAKPSDSGLVKDLAPEPKPAPEPAPPPTALPPSPPVADTQPQAATGPSSPAKTEAAAPTSAPPPAWPALRLQAIFFRLNKPSIRLNGKTLYVGDSVDAVRVVGIERESVTVAFAGQTKVLALRK